MKFKILYNANSNNWHDGEWAIMFTKSEINYLTELYQVRGYLYLEKIYDAFGIEWNPYEKNVCWIYERDGELDIKWTVDTVSESIVIVIFHTENTEEES